MATLTIRNVDEDLKVALRIQAARHGAIHGSGVTDHSATRC
jgi:plasmid stability protein